MEWILPPIPDSHTWINFYYSDGWIWIVWSSHNGPGDMYSPGHDDAGTTNYIAMYES